MTSSRTDLSVIVVIVQLVCDREHPAKQQRSWGMVRSLVLLIEKQMEQIEGINGLMEKIPLSFNEMRTYFKCGFRPDCLFRSFQYAQL
jgi:methylphosphotriester-DNA--protein-cysteine methyltransferase